MSAPTVVLFGAVAGLTIFLGLPLARLRGLPARRLVIATFVLSGAAAGLRGAIYLSQSLRFLVPVSIGDTITATVTVAAYEREKKRMTLETICRNQRGEEVLTGEAKVLYEP